ncbi:hypothetical protein ACM0CQ_11925 [Mycobacteroides abscessus subsp. abscessus]|uniref:hypothetical protein n=1 Tax=Mycobacteroides abscessus TaxID=36809 RepID=UPI0039F10F4F
MTRSAAEQPVPGLGYLAIATIVLLVCLAPVVAYRVWCWRRQRSSPTAALATVGLIALWLWAALLGWWEMLPPVVKAVEVAGAPGVILVSILHVLAIRLRSVSLRRLAADLWPVVIAASCVLTVMTTAVLAGNAEALDLDTYRFNAAPDMDNAGLLVAAVIANVYMAGILVQWIWLGIRRADNTPGGWGVGLLAAGAASCLIPVVWGGILHHLRIVTVGDSMWLNTIPATFCAVLLLAGFTVPPLMIHTQSRQKLRQLIPIRAHLLAQFPSLDTPIAPGSRRADVAHEWCSQIQDGLTLTAQLRDTPLTGARPPAALAFHADAVARWLAGDPEPALNCRWLLTPEQTNSQDWVLAIATRFQRYACDEGVSGSPSTLRR